jgi:addiction module HigA family antidote
MKTTSPRKAHPIGGADITKMRRPPAHPGEIFDFELLRPIGTSRREAARRLRISSTRLNEICRGRRPVTPESAVLLAAVSGTSAQLWLHLQADYDLWHALRDTDTSKVQPLGRRR